MKFTALLKFTKTSEGRTKPINCDYYITLIKIGENSYVSGAIKVKGEKMINPGEQIQVEMYIPSDDLIGKVSVGQVLTFWEPPIKIGEITIMDIIEEA